MTILRKVFDSLRSKTLALALMIAILISAVIGTAILPEQAGRTLVFDSLWFNTLLILLTLNTACCFVSRIRRGWDLVSAGMILFHLSFVAIFVGIVIDSLFYYKGVMRLTEGESVEMSDANAYDEEYWGRFFDHSAMRGGVTFHRMHTDYREDGLKKGPANEISIVDGDRRVRDIIYPTRHLTFNGFKFFRGTDGFSPLFVLYDRRGREIYGAYTALQSFQQKDKSFVYATGTKKDGPGSAEFPQMPGMPPLFKIQFIYHLPKLRGGFSEASFKVWEYDKAARNGQGALVYEGRASMGEKISFRGYSLSMNEVRYWASMDVLYNPGQPIVLVSLWVSMSGIVMTFIGRRRRGGKASVMSDQQ